MHSGMRAWCMEAGINCNQNTDMGNGFDLIMHARPLCRKRVLYYVRRA